MTALPEQDLEEAERRVAPRQRVLKRAKIIFNQGFSIFDCVVRNISATGALLTLAESVHMPKEFQIKIGEEPPRPAKLVYRRTMFAGIRFLDMADAAGELEPRPIMPAEPASSAAADEIIAKIRPNPLPRSVAKLLPWA
ncbi:PilZ domain-containing protein [Fulvimarina manganoxydans]|uniref:PilZ domain-containing protein n=1 Tax=Fulvimarina manganoxydans TaxID=937218 RepID=A0A1W2D7F4_9HYPH|nr:PilZ domain-containing protein [Fulvimarina manganoxydans]SMC93353.1 PilZ domain-containing protein [Fulvimarina manganoxydans]